MKRSTLKLLSIVGMLVAALMAMNIGIKPMFTKEGLDLTVVLIALVFVPSLFIFLMTCFSEEE